MVRFSRKCIADTLWDNEANVTVILKAYLLPNKVMEYPNFFFNDYLQNFLALCASGFYNGCVFHRNIKGFMVQTGDPTGTGLLHLLHFTLRCQNSRSRFLLVDPCILIKPFRHRQRRNKYMGPQI